MKHYGYVGAFLDRPTKTILRASYIMIDELSFIAGEKVELKVNIYGNEIHYQTGREPVYFRNYEITTADPLWKDYFSQDVLDGTEKTLYTNALDCLREKISVNNKN